VQRASKLCPKLDGLAIVASGCAGEPKPKIEATTGWFPVFEGKIAVLRTVLLSMWEVAADGVPIVPRVVVVPQATK
jgi:hypothetical protein